MTLRLIFMVGVRKPLSMVHGVFTTTMHCISSCGSMLVLTSRIRVSSSELDLPRPLAETINAVAATRLGLRWVSGKDGYT